MESIAEPWSFASPDDVLQRLLRMQAITSALSAASSVENVAEVLVREVVELLGAAASVVYSLEPGQTHARLVGSVGLPPSVPQTLAMMSLETPLPLAVSIRTGKALTYENMDQLLEAFPHLRAAQTPSATYQATATLPFIDQGRVLGGFGVSFSQPREFSPLDRRFLVALSELCSQAIERARTRAREARALAQAEELRLRLAVLADLDAALADSHGLSEMEQRLLAVVQRLVPSVAELCALDLVDATGQFESWAVAHVDPERARTLRTMRAARGFTDASISPAARAFHSQQALRVADLGEGVLARVDLAGLDSPQRRSALFVPLTAHGRPVGVLTLARTEAYTDEDLHFAQDVGRRISLGVDRWLLQDDCSAAIRAREEFFTLTAHELKTPLTVAQLHVQSLARRVPADAQFATSVRATSSALRRISWLVDASRNLALALAHPKQRLRAADVAAIAREVVARSSPQLASEGLQVLLEAGAEARAEVDPELIEAAVEALLAFATQDLPFGEVRLTIAGGADGVELSCERPANGARAKEGPDTGGGELRPSPSLGEFLVGRVAQALHGRSRVEQGAAGARLILSVPRTQPELLARSR